MFEEKSSFCSHLGVVCVCVVVPQKLQYWPKLIHFFRDFVHTYTQSSLGQHISTDIYLCELDLQMTLTLVSVSLKSFNIGHNFSIC